jgi:hypothetical protein
MMVDLCEGFPGKFICEMCGNLNIVSRREKTKKNGNNCQKGLKHKYMVSFAPGNDLVIIFLPKVTRSPNICFSGFLSWPLLTSKILNDGRFV